MFLKIEGIDGEAVDPDHDKWIPILNIRYQQEMGIHKNKQIIRKGKCPDIATISFTKDVDSSSTQLARYASTGTLTEYATIHVLNTTEPSREPYLRYELTKVLITSYGISESSTNDESPPTEEITLAFGEVAWSYIKIDPDKSATGSWNIKSNCKA